MTDLLAETTEYQPAAQARDGRRRETKTVAMVGHSPSTRDQAPFADPTAEIWTMNDAHVWIPRADRWFELHSESVFRSLSRRTAGYVDFLRQFRGPVYMQDAFMDMPTSVRYPLEYMVQKYGRVFSSSFSWMLAMAIEEQYTRIEIYGCDLASNTEYAEQRESTGYWIGLARGLGIEVFLPEACPLLKGPLYGRNERLGPVTHDFVANHFNELRKAQADAAARVNILSGRIEEHIMWQNIMESAGYQPKPEQPQPAR